jgi:threonine aldolase
MAAELEDADLRFALERDLPRTIDTRSDTVTRPSAAMRQAMMEAAVGDDVWGDDPTVEKLERACARLLGKEAAIFVPSGCMGNLIAILVHCDRRGSEMIVGDRSHIHMWEQGSSATLGHVHSRVLVTQPDGTLRLDEVERAVRSVDDHHPVTRLVCIENTHNACGGRVLSVEYMDKLGAVAKKHNIAFHVDGARLANAAAALKVPMARLARAADTVMLCLSKGIGAPVGSVLAGPSGFVAQARRERKALGGAMRQAGCLAAAAMVGLRDVLPLLHLDHANAKTLARELAALPGLRVNVEVTESNLVYVDFEPHLDIELLTRMCKAKGVLVAGGNGSMRLAMHWQISAADVQTIVSVFKEFTARRA